VAGYEEYATRIRGLYGDDIAPLADLLEGLFHIALADGDYHHNEDAFLTRVAELWGLPERDFHRMRARFVPDSDQDPFDVLGLSRDATPDQIRAAWRMAVRDSHPDRLAARGVPPEAVKLAEARLIAINRAWERIGAG